MRISCISCFYGWNFWTAFRASRLLSPSGPLSAFAQDPLKPASSASQVRPALRRCAIDSADRNWRGRRAQPLRSHASMATHDENPRTRSKRQIDTSSDHSLHQAMADARSILSMQTPPTRGLRPPMGPKQRGREHQHNQNITTCDPARALGLLTRRLAKLRRRERLARQGVPSVARGNPTLAYCGSRRLRSHGTKLSARGARRAPEGDRH